MIVKKQGAWKNALILLPHCIQNDDCEHRVVKTITNCVNCGSCRISEISRFSRENLIEAKVATGGRLAKRWVEQYKPDFVIAVACERELCEGIPAVFPIPVIAVINERPNGPCVNTDVNMEKLHGAIKI